MVNNSKETASAESNLKELDLDKLADLIVEKLEPKMISLLQKMMAGKMSVQEAQAPATTELAPDQTQQGPQPKAEQLPTWLYACKSTNGILGKITSQYNKETTVYKINATNKTFWVDEKAYKRISHNRESWLGGEACSYTGGGSTVEPVEAGKVELQPDGSWKIIEKVKIKFV